MKMMGIKLPAVIVIFVLTFSGLVLGQGLYYRFSTELPLGQAFKEIDEVRNFEVVRRDGRVYVKVMLGDVANLRDVYNEIHEKAEEYVGKSMGSITLCDTRDKELEELYYSIHFYIQEAIATGNFSEMERNIREVIADSEICRVYVEEERIFLQIHKDDKYLYEVIPRGASLQQAQEESGRRW